MNGKSCSTVSNDPLAADPPAMVARIYTLIHTGEGWRISDETHKARLAAWRKFAPNKAAAARECGIPRKTFSDWLDRQASLDTGGDQFVVTGRSTLRDAAGNLVMEWEKTSLDREARLEAEKAAYAAMAESLPRAEPVSGPYTFEADLCNLYTFTDYHMGMLAWHKEGGADWDLRIAEETLLRAFTSMIEQTPVAAKCIINLQGDFLHTDGLLPVTPASGHVLDADGRYSKIVAVAIKCIRRIVRMALERHEHVHLIICEGNHDERGALWMRQMFTALYDEEPRITVNASELPFYVHQHGDVMLGFHHGHKVKNEQLPLLFAAQFRREWGSSTKAYIHCGHRHHMDAKEYNGALVVQHPTLAARDGYAARGGWIAERAALAITYHKRRGQVEWKFVTPEELAA